MRYQAPQTDPVLALKPLTLWTSGCGLPSCRPADRMGAGVQRRSPEQAQTGPKRARPPMHTNTATSSCCQCGWSHGGRASSLLSMVAGGPAGPRQHISLGPQVQCLAASSWLAGRPEACGGQPEGVGHLSVLVGSPGACCGDRAAWKVSLARAKACSRVADVHPCKRQQRSASAAGAQPNSSTSSSDPVPGNQKASCDPLDAAGARAHAVPASGSARVATGCAVHCRPRERRWQLALLLGEGVSKARRRAPGSAAPYLRCRGLQLLSCCTSAHNCRVAHKQQRSPSQWHLA